MAYISAAVLPANGSDKLLPPSFDKYHLLGGKVNILYLQIACVKTSCLLKKNERVSMHHTWDNNDFTTTKKVKKKNLTCYFLSLNIRQFQQTKYRMS